MATLHQVTIALPFAKDEFPQKRLARLIRVSRVAAGLTQLELAEKINVAQNTICAWEENGSVSGAMLSAIAIATGQSMEVFRL